MKFIFSVQNEYIHKVVTILGIKLKFRNRRLEYENKYQKESSQLRNQIEILSEKLTHHNKELLDSCDKLSDKYSELFNKYIGISQRVEQFRTGIVLPPAKDTIRNLKERKVLNVHIPTNFNVIGRNTYAQPDLWVQNPNESKIGSFCSLGNRIILGHGDHPINYISTSPYFYFSGLNWKNENMPTHSEFWDAEPINIGNDVWIGDGVFVKNGVNIGDGAIVASRAVVTKDVPPYAIVAGVPAKVIKYRFDENIIKELLELKWWELDDEIIKQIPYENIEDAIDFLKNVKKGVNNAI